MLQLSIDQRLQAIGMLTQQRVAGIFDIVRRIIQKLWKLRLSTTDHGQDVHL